MDSHFRSFGWNVITVSGLDLSSQLIFALKMSQNSNTPTIILAKTG